MTFDNQAIKQRIVDIIKADENLYNAKGEDGKLAEVFIGVPKNNNLFAITPTPFLIITNHTKLLSRKPYESQVDNQWTAQENMVQYFLMVIDRQNDGILVEKSLDTILMNLQNCIDRNITLRKSDGTDKKVLQSHLQDFEALQSGQYKGKATDGFTVTMVCKLISRTT